MLDATLALADGGGAPASLLCQIGRIMTAAAGASRPR